MLTSNTTKPCTKMATYEQSVAAIDMLIATTAAHAQAADAKVAEAMAAVNNIADAAVDRALYEAATANRAAEIAANQHGFLQKYHDDYDHNINCSEWSFSWNRNEQYFEALDAYTVFLRMKGCKVKREENRQEEVMVYVTRQYNILCNLL